MKLPEWLPEWEKVEWIENTFAGTVVRKLQIYLTNEQEAELQSIAASLRKLHAAAYTQRRDTKRCGSGYQVAPIYDPPAAVDTVVVAGLHGMNIANKWSIQRYGAAYARHAPRGRKTCNRCGVVSLDRAWACPSCGKADWWGEEGYDEPRPFPPKGWERPDDLGPLVYCPSSAETSLLNLEREKEQVTGYTPKCADCISCFSGGCAVGATKRKGKPCSKYEPENEKVSVRQYDAAACTSCAHHLMGCEYKFDRDATACVRFVRRPVPRAAMLSAQKKDLTKLRHCKEYPDLAEEYSAIYTQMEQHTLKHVNSEFKSFYALLSHWKEHRQTCKVAKYNEGRPKSAWKSCSECGKPHEPRLPRIKVTALRTLYSVSYKKLASLRRSKGLVSMGDFVSCINKIPKGTQGVMMGVPDTRTTDETKYFAATEAEHAVIRWKIYKDKEPGEDGKVQPYKKGERKRADIVFSYPHVDALHYNDRSTFFHIHMPGSKRPENAKEGKKKQTSDSNACAPVKGEKRKIKFGARFTFRTTQDVPLKREEKGKKDKHVDWGECTLHEKHGKFFIDIATKIGKGEQKEHSPAKWCFIDLGMRKLAVCYMWTGEVLAYPHNIPTPERKLKLKRLSQKIGQVQVGSRRWCRLVAKAEKVETKMRNRALDHIHKVTKEIAKLDVDVFVIGNLNSSEMAKKDKDKERTGIEEGEQDRYKKKWFRDHLSTHWRVGQTVGLLVYKVHYRRDEIGKTSEAYSSQRCPVCRTLNKTSNERYICSNCGLNADRDIVGVTGIMYNVDKSLALPPEEFVERFHNMKWNLDKKGLCVHDGRVKAVTLPDGRVIEPKRNYKLKCKVDVKRYEREQAAVPSVLMTEVVYEGQDCNA